MLIAYKEKALTQLQALPHDLQNRIVEKIEFWASQPYPLSFAKHLAGYNVYRFRVCDYRVIADVEAEALVILLVVKREGAYRNL